MFATFERHSMEAFLLDCKQRQRKMDVYVLEDMMTNEVLDRAVAISRLFSSLSNLPTMTESVFPTKNKVQVLLNDLTHAVRNDLQVIGLQIDLLDLTQTDGPAVEILLQRLMRVSRLLQQGRGILAPSSF
jgi:hypothetical protein